MIAQVLVYTVLLLALGAMVYVVGMPWLTPKPQRYERKLRQKRIRDKKAGR